MRRLKSINVFFDPVNTSIKEIENIPNFKELVYGELYEAILEGKRENVDIIPLFEINNSGNILKLKKDDWGKALNEAIAFYEKKEEYEKCRSYKNLMDNIYEQRDSTNSNSDKQLIKGKNTTRKKTTRKKANI